MTTATTLDLIKLNSTPEIPDEKGDAPLPPAIETLKRSASFQREFLEAPRASLSPRVTAPPSKELLKNLKLANTISDHVQTTVPVILNYLERCKIDYTDTGFTMESFSHFASSSYEVFYARNESDFETLLSDGSSLFQKAKALSNIADTAKKCQMGTCLEMSAVGLTFFLENCEESDEPPAENIEIFKIEGGNHIFIVLGRNPASNPADYAKWGPHAVVCDPWAGAVYPSSEIESRLKSYKGQNSNSGTVKTILEPFDSSRQELDLLFTLSPFTK